MCERPDLKIRPAPRPRAKARREHRSEAWQRFPQTLRLATQTTDDRPHGQQTLPREIRNTYLLLGLTKSEKSGTWLPQPAAIAPKIRRDAQENRAVSGGLARCRKQRGRSCCPLTPGSARLAKTRFHGGNHAARQPCPKIATFMPELAACPRRSCAGCRFLWQSNHAAPAAVFPQRRRRAPGTAESSAPLRGRQTLHPVAFLPLRGLAALARHRRTVGASPSGKAAVFGTAIPRFES